MSNVQSVLLMGILIMFSSCYKHEFACECNGTIIEIGKMPIAKAKITCREMSRNCKAGALIR